MIKVGIDIGGTFTDATALDLETGRFWSAKVPTTYPDPAQGFLQSLKKLIDMRHLTQADVDWIIHGTTLVTNVVLERKGGPVGLLTTEGFGDTLWIRTERRYDLFDVMIEFPEPLVERWRTAEIPERVRYDGSVFRALDKANLEQTVDRLVASGVNAIAVCLLHSYANPAHEDYLRNLILSRHPNMRVSLSSEVWPESGEYYRMSTTVANAYVQPVVDQYLDQLTNELSGNGFNGKFYLMLSNGGTAAISTGRSLPVQLLESGPAAGVLSATFLAEQAHLKDILSFDMGGTTAKLSLIEQGIPLTADFIEVARIKRYMAGSGIPVKVPVIDLLEIGSGGGSIAWIDHMGLLKVGPESSGSSPGPACYGWGGTRPTVTDADAVLGYLNPHNFLGGEMTLDVEAASSAIAAHIATPTHLSVPEAARGIHEVVNQSMALAAKKHVLERGKDPTRYALVAYGGAGPVHAYGVGKTLGVSQVIIPPSAGVAASLGLLIAPIAFDLMHSQRMSLHHCDWSAVQAGYTALEEKGAEILAAADVPHERVRFSRSADMRYVGQGYEVTATIPAGALDDSSRAAIQATFEEAYKARYTHLPAASAQIEFVRLRVRAWTEVAQPRLPRKDSQNAELPAAALRDAYFDGERGYVPTPVYQWSELVPNHPIPGPVIIEADDTTVVIGPEGTLTMNEIGYLTIDMQRENH
ncbi:MAG TPA: hydantoinase/oxoprolinase family protein [Phototrophicaceae bacterium]|nr:hydantoinase/oxoprolinase family protein [Phototrophicaceae bacterium]